MIRTPVSVSNHFDHVFSAFFATKPGGMGMGLSISRAIIEAQGGQLWATPNRRMAPFFSSLSPPRDRTRRR